MSIIDLPINMNNNDTLPIDEEHKIILVGEINSETTNNVVSQLYELESINKKYGVSIPIKLLINSPGGDLYSSQMICDVMNEISTPVYTCAYGQACSGGFIIFMNGENGYRISGKYTQFMTHRFRTSMEGSQSDFKEYGVVMESMLDQLVSFYKDCTNLNEKVILEDLLNDKDVYLSPIDCYHYNVVDQIIGEDLSGITRKHTKTRRSRNNKE